MANSLWKYIKALQIQVAALSSGPGTGDMTKAVYDPGNKNSNAFSQDNMVDGSTNKNYTGTEKTKLGGIAANANNYSHPANHAPSVISQDASNRFVTDTEKGTWNGKANGTHNHSATEITTGTLDGDRLPAISETKKGAVPATGAPSGKFLKDDNTWASVVASANPYIAYILGADLTVPAGNCMIAEDQYEISDTFTLELADTAYLGIT